MYVSLQNTSTKNKSYIDDKFEVKYCEPIEIKYIARSFIPSINERINPYLFAHRSR